MCVRGARGCGGWRTEAPCGSGGPTGAPRAGRHLAGFSHRAGRSGVPERESVADRLRGASRGARGGGGGGSSGGRSGEFRIGASGKLRWVERCPGRCRPPQECSETLLGAASPVARDAAEPPCALLGAAGELGERAKLGDLEMQTGSCALIRVAERGEDVISDDHVSDAGRGALRSWRCRDKATSCSWL